jgi:hypothetical protein
MSEGGQVTSRWKANVRKRWYFLRKRWYILLSYLVLISYELGLLLYTVSGGFVFSYKFQTLEIIGSWSLVVLLFVSYFLMEKDMRKTSS